MSGSSGCLAMPWATSTRKPSTPRSSQKRRIESNSSSTSWFVQLRSGCSGAKRCNYRSPGAPLASVTRCQAGPPKTLCQSLGGSLWSGPRPSRKTYRARSGLWGGDARAATNQGCWSDVWFGTRSTMTLSRRVWASAIGRRSRPGSRTWGRHRGSRRRRSRRRPGARDRTGSPDGVDAEIVDVRQPGADAGQVAHPVAVGVGEAADVDLIDHGAPPPRTVGHGAGYPAGTRTGGPNPGQSWVPSSTLVACPCVGTADAVTTRWPTSRRVTSARRSEEPPRSGHEPVRWNERLPSQSHR